MSVAFVRKGMLRMSVPLFFVCSCLGEDFRGYDWGTPKERILEEMGPPIREEPDLSAVVYEDSIAGVAMEVHFRFEEGNLQTGAYYSRTPWRGVTGAVDEFARFEEIFSEKYKMSPAVSEFWFDDSYKEDADGRESALVLGHLLILTERELGRTNVVHQLAGSGPPEFGFEHRIFYKAQVDVTPPEVSPEDLDKL